jgi:hypothetical protein
MGMPLKVAVKLLDYISAEHYHEWVQVGMALRASYGEEGFEAWHSWSQKSTKYRGVKELEFKWKTFKRDGVSAGTIVHLAKRGGWTESEWRGERGGQWNDDWQPDVTLGFVDSGEVVEVEEDVPFWKRSKPVFPTEWAPGLVGDVAEWIGSCALYPMPKQQLAAAIAAVSAIKSHRCKGATNLRTNMYTISLGLSGSGKEHPRQCIESLFLEAGCIELLKGEPKSDVGLLKSLRNTEACGLLMWDEFHRALRSLSSKYASTHFAAILEVFVKLFSRAGKKYIGNEYANHDGKMPRVDLVQPCFSFFATCVPSGFKEALTASDSEDGLLARMMVFDSDDYVEDPVENRCSDEPPEYLIEKVKWWRSQPRNFYALNHLDAALNISPRCYEMDEEATELLKSYRKMMRHETAIAPPMIAPILARAAEHCEKLAMVASHDDCRDDGINYVIDGSVMRWAIKVTNYCILTMCQMCDNSISLNEEDKIKKKVMKIFYDKRGWLSQSALVRSTQYLNRRQRGDILSDLVEGGRIECKQSEPSGKGRPVVMYRFNG